jgi:hypothetical protein
MPKNNKIVIASDHVKDGKRASREIFKGVSLGSRRHKDKTVYNRKQKHRKSHE